MLRHWLPSWFSPVTRRSTPRGNRTQLQLTSLERRDTPSAPVIQNFSGRMIGDTWIVTGTVVDETAGKDAVAISGDVSGSATVHSDGSFEFITQHPGGGSIAAQATDVESLTSAPVSAKLNTPAGNQAPYLTMSVAYGSQRSVTLSGQVYDESPGGLAVSLSGVAAGTATTDSSGHYSVTLTATGLGQVMGTVTDSSNVSSTAAYVALLNNVPQITNFAITTDSLGVYTIRGKVVDEDPAGLTVTLSSAIAQFNGRQITVGSDGWFQITISAGRMAVHGETSATVTDWWGQTSDPVYDTI
jgi:hypothetical protein